MDIYYTQAPESELSRKLQAHLAIVLRPTAEKAAEENRVTGLLFDAAHKRDRAEFHRLWRTHVLPLKKNPAAGIRSQTSPDR